MPDYAISSSPAVQAQLDRLWALSPGADVLGLDRIAALLALLGNPERSLPPVFHVAGTNGKGSTCAFLRAMLEAAGLRVHAYTSPHLVRFNERIRIAGRLIDDDALAPLLAEVLDAGGAIGATFFEVTTTCAFLAFARTPADACVIEVGLGGRLDATNVIPAPVVCGIASLGIDHEAFLLAPEAGTPVDPLDRIAFEKAGIAKSGVPLVTQAYTRSMANTVAAVARGARAPLFVRDGEWRVAVTDTALHYSDAQGAIDLPLPSLAGAHQADNAALAVAMLRHQQAVPVPVAAMARGIAAAHWPGRLQRLATGPLTALAGDRPVWLDGGHNPDAGARIAAAFAPHAPDGRDGPLDLILGMLANKNPAAILIPLVAMLGNRLRSAQVVPVPGHDWHPAAAFAHGAVERADLPAALANTRHPVLIAGSLYLVGEALRLNCEPPE